MEEDVFAGGAMVQPEQNSNVNMARKYSGASRSLQYNKQYSSTSGAQHYNRSKLKQSGEKSKFAVVHKRLGCGRCGMVHEFRCPAEGKECSYCGEKNHFARRCRKRLRTIINQAQQIHTADDSDGEHQDNDSGDLFVGRIEIKNKGKVASFIEVRINNRKMVCQVMSVEEYKRLGFSINQIQKTSSKIFGLGGNEVEVIGTKFVELEANNGTFSIRFHIIKGNTQGIIGLPFIVKMKLLERTDKSKHTFNNINNVEICNWLKKYKDLFKGLGCLNEECKLILKDNVTPTIDPPR